MLDRATSLAHLSSSSEQLETAAKITRIDRHGAPLTAASGAGPHQS